MLKFSQRRFRQLHRKCQNNVAKLRAATETFCYFYSTQKPCFTDLRWYIRSNGICELDLGIGIKKTPFYQILSSKLIKKQRFSVSSYLKITC